VVASTGTVWLRRQSSVDTDAFLVDTQINVSTPEEVLFPIKRVFFSRSGTTAYGTRQQQQKIGGNERG
jgi:hypothetical protein